MPIKPVTSERIAPPTTARNWPLDWVEANFQRGPTPVEAIRQNRAQPRSGPNQCGLDYSVPYATIRRGTGGRTIDRLVMTSAKNIPDVSFAKVREDHSTETAEDYVEGISDIIHRQGECRVKDVAKHMDVSHVTVVRIIARLAKEGLGTAEPYRPLRLTAEGEQLAAQSRRRHETVLSFLLALGVRPTEAARDAEGMEDHVSPDTLERMKAFLAERGRKSKRSSESD